MHIKLYETLKEELELEELEEDSSSQVDRALPSQNCGSDKITDAKAGTIKVEFQLLV